MSASEVQRWITCLMAEGTAEFWAFTRTLSDGEATDTPKPIRLTGDFVMALIQVKVRVNRIVPHPDGARLLVTVPATLTPDILQQVLELYCIQLTWDPKEVYFTHYGEEGMRHVIA